MADMAVYQQVIMSFVKKRPGIFFSFMSAAPYFHASTIGMRGTIFEGTFF